MQAHLTEDQRRQFEEEGYLVVRGVLEQSEIERLTEKSDTLLASDSQKNRLVWERSDGFRNLIGRDDVFIPLIKNEKVLPLIVEILGYNIRLLSSHVIYRLPDSPETPDTMRSPTWHRDIAGSTHDLGHDKTPRMEIKAAFYLTDCRKPTSGATLICPGSNNLKDPPPFAEGAPDPEGVVEPSLAPGDALLFENRTWHAGGLNRSGRTRKCLIYGYGFRWLAPDVPIESDVVAKLAEDEIAYQLAGGVNTPAGRYVPGAGNEPLKNWCREQGIPL